MTNNIATLHPKYSGITFLPNGESVTTAAAIERGYSIQGAQPTRPTVSTPISVQPIRPPTYRQQLCALPEAINRQSAAVALAEGNTINTLPLSAAASLLRGLPIEGNDDAMTIAPQLSAADHEMFKRRLDIRMAGLRKSAEYGSEAASDELTKLNSASRIVQSTGVSWGAAFTMAGLEARSTIKTILEIGPR